VLLKLPADRYDELAAFITERHSYDEPEIIALPILTGSAAYLNWMREETRPVDPAQGILVIRLRRGRHVPGRDDRLGVFGTQGADRPGVQPEQPPVRRGEPQVAGGEHAQNVAVGDQRDVAVG